LFGHGAAQAQDASRFRDTQSGGLEGPTKTGFPILAAIAFSVESVYVDHLLQLFRDRKEVVWACSVTGRFDLLALAAFRSNEEFALFLTKERQGFEGIKDSETFVCLRQCEHRWIPQTLSDALTASHPTVCSPPGLVGNMSVGTLKRSA